MRNAIIGAFLIAVGFVWTSQAVVIHWATEGVPAGTLSAQLVYVSSGSPAYAADAISNGSEIGDAVSGLAITPLGVGEQATTDAATRTQGAYFVVLFRDNAGQTEYSYSSSSLAWNDPDSITQDEMTPATSVFNPGTFSGWAPIPEPTSVALLGLGAAALALRRRKRG